MPQPKNQTHTGMPLAPVAPAAVCIMMLVVIARPATDRMVVTQYPRLRMFIGSSSSRPRTKKSATMVDSRPKARTTSGKKIQAWGLGQPRSLATK